MNLLAQKTALITGAAQGIGYAVAEAFLENGARVILSGRAPDALAEAGHALKRIYPDRVACVTLDLADPNGIETGVDQAAGYFGGLDILVNNAAIHIAHPFLEFPLADFEQVFRINVTGTFLCSQAAARRMTTRGGSIIFIASASAKKADPLGSAYNASKSALVGLARVMALELGPLNIRVNTLLPGATDTDMLRDLFRAAPGLQKTLADRTPLGRMASPRDQANAALFLASDLAAHITGEQLVVSGGEFMET
jgi:NAD(P)-dependent dehydrogenase (short-subunit alcohol dehydrogenase family)